MKNVFKYCLRARGLCLLFMFLSIISTLLSIIEPKVTANMVNSLTERDLDNMSIFAIVVAVVAIVRAILKFVVRNTAVNVNATVSKFLQEDLCEKALNIKSSFLADFKSGELAEITKSNPADFMQRLQKSVMMLFGILAEIAITIYVAILSWQSFLLFLVFLVIIATIQKFSLNKEEKNTKEGKKKNDTAKSLINQIYRGISDIKIFNLKNPILDRYSCLLDEEIEAGKKKEHARSSNRLFSNISFELYALLFILLGVFLIRKGSLEIGAFITIYMYKNALYCLIFDIAEFRSECSEMKVLAERINKILLIEDYKLENFGNMHTGNTTKHEIEVSDLTFSYDNNVNILENVSLNFKQGQFIGLVGESGSAKTTLIKLLSRQLEPCAGRIKIDGIDIKKYSAQGFTNLVSLASQEPFIFSFSIRENLMMVKPEATEAQLWKALEEAQILDFVRALPHGLDTVLHENIKLSGGQKQRLSLARLFLKNTSIILMDEATSALDNRTQAEITDLIKKRSTEGHKIFICIAHRIEAVEKADKIIFMKDGKVFAHGTHEELLKNAEYLKLLNREKE